MPHVIGANDVAFTTFGKILPSLHPQTNDDRMLVNVACADRVGH